MAATAAFPASYPTHLDRGLVSDASTRKMGGTEPRRRRRPGHGGPTRIPLHTYTHFIPKGKGRSAIR